MANVIHLRCHRCGEPLQDRDAAYCPPCNLYLAYRAMPFLLGMLLLGKPTAVRDDPCPHDPAAGDEEAPPDLTAINWE